MSFQLLFRSLHFRALVFATIRLVCFVVQDKKVGKNSCFGVSLFRGLVMPRIITILELKGLLLQFICVMLFKSISKHLYLHWIQLKSKTLSRLSGRVPPNRFVTLSIPCCCSSFPSHPSPRKSPHGDTKRVWSTENFINILYPSCVTFKREKKYISPEKVKA